MPDCKGKKSFTPTKAPNDRMQTFYLRIRPDKIALFRFLLEGYDGLAVLSTMEAKQGLVRLIVPTSRYRELWQLLFAICEELCPASSYANTA
ncbi:MAG: DUF4911 domain-containing protein [Candidatus Electrothrix sp. AW2]|nr:DUF4911 domain-containing protein [Candidatus Electrothrix gigas]MCI5134599.1 DUF4911 domain-containing protein [Candidatus Electrothrix gigas]